MTSRIFITCSSRMILMTTKRCVLQRCVDCFFNVDHDVVDYILQRFSILRWFKSSIRFEFIEMNVMKIDDQIWAIVDINILLLIEISISLFVIFIVNFILWTIFDVLKSNRVWIEILLASIESRFYYFDDIIIIQFESDHEWRRRTMLL